MSKTISSQKRRRHSTEPSPGKSQSFSEKPSSKKLITDNEFKTVTMSKQSQPPVSNPSTQSNQSIFTDNDVNRLAQAVKAIMFEDLRNELKSDLQMYCNSLTVPLFTEIEKLKTENIELKKSINEVGKLSLKVDDLEQHSRKSCIRISGVPYTQSEDTTKILCDIASKLEVDLQSNDISVSHRLPTKEGHKQIIARFTHTKKRAEFLKATKNIRNIPDLHGVGISQDLTKARSRVAFLAREAVRKGKLKSSSVWDGKIFLTAKNDDKRIVSTESELKDFINGKPGLRRSDIEHNVVDMPIARSPGTPHYLPNNMMFPPQMMQYQSGAQAMYPQMFGIMS
ncbi:uncharacterized protein LOC127699205 [Mytilus californianus]|uniref:uncharacterized protein LOC127699205 n=1 Tax=Mytilus californianus TaxID=6549 RepID=UPI002246C9AA|nr:uncharacterized protein LOC127699205 [Mytilus californianus]